MQRLIINADDLGVNAARSHGIFQCAEFGIVASASLIANGSDSDAAGKHAREKNLACGLHLNITEEYPLSKRDDVMTLTDMNGAFLGKDRLLQALADGKVERTHLDREVRAQMEWCFDVHGSMSHFNGHHHVHLHPFIAETVIPLLERYGVRFVRIPCELPLPPYGYEITDDKLAWAQSVNQQATHAREMYAAHGIGSTDNFRGLTLHGNASLKNLRHNLSRLQDGTTELAVHPGSMSAYGTPFDLDPQRQTELRMLTDPTIPALLAEKKIALCSWADL